MKLRVIPTNVGSTRSTTTATTPLVVVSDGGGGSKSGLVKVALRVIFLPPF